MFDTPYQTTPCLRFDLSKTISAVREMEIREELLPVTGSNYGIKVVPPGVKVPLPFWLPITQREIKTLEAPAVFDGRTLLRQDGRPIKEDAYNLTVMMAELTIMWYQGSETVKRDLLNIGDFPIKMFTAWVGNTLANRMTLDLSQATLLKAALAIYYVQLFSPLTESSSQEDIDKVLVRASRALSSVDPLTLAEAVGTVPPLPNIRSFVDWAIKLIDSPRMETFNVSIMYTALGTTFGPQYREAVAVALEYPPLWLAILFSACNDRNARTTSLGDLVKRLAQKDADKEFLKSMNQLLKSR